VTLDTLILESVTATNWEAYARLAIAQEQETWLQSNLFVLARARFEPLELWGIKYGATCMGMAAVLHRQGISWICHFMIEHTFQQKGLGKKALKLLLNKIYTTKGKVEVRVGIVHENTIGAYFFVCAGFEKVGVMPDGELILRKNL